jgi:hypothetical protein
MLYGLAFVPILQDNGLQYSNFHYELTVAMVVISSPVCNCEKLQAGLAVIEVG